jgi:hypothetical protein
VICVFRITEMPFGVCEFNVEFTGSVRNSGSVARTAGNGGVSLEKA